MRKFTIFIFFFVNICAQLFSSDRVPGDEPGPSFVLFPIDKSTISAQADAVILNFPFKEGASFKEGELLVKLNDNLYFQYYNVAKADSVKVSATSDFAKSIFEKNQEMYNKNGLSQQELEKSKLDYLISEAEKEKAEADLKIAEEKLSFCSIKAPFSGSVTRNIKHDYEFVRASEPVIEIINDKQLLAVMNLPSTRFSEVEKWKVKEFYVDELKKSFNGSIYEISADINSGSRTFEIKFLIENPAGEIKAGMSGYMIE